jgi:hypothetical protein
MDDQKNQQEDTRTRHCHLTVNGRAVNQTSVKIRPIHIDCRFTNYNSSNFQQLTLSHGILREILEKLGHNVVDLVFPDVKALPTASQEQFDLMQT